MKRRFSNPTAALLLALLLLASPSQAGPGICWYECNIDGRDYCFYTGDCFAKCWNMAGGCLSGTSAECYDQCAF